MPTESKKCPLIDKDCQECVIIEQHWDTTKLLKDMSIAKSIFKKNEVAESDYSTLTLSVIKQDEALKSKYKEGK